MEMSAKLHFRVSELQLDVSNVSALALCRLIGSHCSCDIAELVSECRVRQKCLDIEKSRASQNGANKIWQIRRLAGESLVSSIC